MDTLTAYYRHKSSLLIVVLAGLAACAADESAPARITSDIAPYTVTQDVAIPMRDGVVLRADIYRPSGDDPFPVLLYRTPYNKSDAATAYNTHLRAVARGYAVILQDVRGRYASGGFFEPYRNEGNDGFDSIEWAAVQPWSNGVVGTYGLSYPGAVQWLAAVQAPPHLVAMAPAMTYSSPRNFFYMNGAFDLSWLPWIYQYIAPDARVRLGLAGITTDAEAEIRWVEVAAEYESFLPLAELPYLRHEAPYYFEWLRHPPESPWWDWAEIRTRYPEVSAAVLNLSGWHDDSYGTEGAATNYNGIAGSRRESGEIRNHPRNHLILGPWNHGVAATAARRIGDLDFGAAAGIDYDEVLLRFFDQYLRNVDTGLESDSPVRYFVMGENAWRESGTWPPAGISASALCFETDADSDSGVLGECGRASDATSSHFIGDPAKPVYDPYDTRGAHDYRPLRSRPDVLVFETPTLASSVTIAGNAIARVFASCDCEDFDLWVRMLDVFPDGRAINLMSPGADSLRASYRDIANGRQLLTPGAVYELTLDGLLTANRFAAGHRIQLQISASFAPHLSRNLQTGESEMISAVAQPAEITIHHSAEYPSRLILPVLSERE